MAVRKKEKGKQETGIVIHSCKQSNQQKPLVNFESAQVVKIQSAPTGLMLQTILSCLPGFLQIGAIAALGDLHFTATCAAEFQARRDFFVEGLNRIKGVHCVKPDGAFYLFPRVDHVGMTGFEYSEKILVEEGLCILPGSSFGDCGSGYMRLSYSNVTLPMIAEALEKMERFHNRHF